MNRIKKVLTVFRCFSLAFALTPGFIGATGRLSNSKIIQRVWRIS